MTPNKAAIFLWLCIIAVIGCEIHYTSPRRSLHAMEQISTQQTLQNAATATGNGIAVGSPVTNCRETAIYISWLANVTSGVVTIESADNTGYTGTWASIVAVTFSGTAPRQDIVQITGIHGALRTRISTLVNGNGVTTRLVCN